MSRFPPNFDWYNHETWVILVPEYVTYPQMAMLKGNFMTNQWIDGFKGFCPKVIKAELVPVPQSLMAGLGLNATREHGREA